MKCPKCGYSFAESESLKEKGFKDKEAKEQLKGLLAGAEGVDVSKASSDYGKPENVIRGMITEIRREKQGKEIIRPPEPGHYESITEPGQMSDSADKNYRNIEGRAKLLAQDRIAQVQKLKQIGTPEALQQAKVIEETYHVFGNVLPELKRAKLLPEGQEFTANGRQFEVMEDEKEDVEKED